AGGAWSAAGQDRENDQHHDSETIHRVQTSSTGSSARTALNMTEWIAGSRNRRSAVSRAGDRSGRLSTLLIMTTTRAPAGTHFRPPSGWASTRATISGVIGLPS